MRARQCIVLYLSCSLVVVAGKQLRREKSFPVETDPEFAANTMVMRGTILPGDEDNPFIGTILDGDYPSSSPSFILETASLEPSAEPTRAPTEYPTVPPSTVPSDFPSLSPSNTPSTRPSVTPTETLSSRPSVAPSATPSVVPSARPSSAPSQSPSLYPSATPSASPSVMPSSSPSTFPSVLPSAIPSSLPSSLPSDAPSLLPSAVPSAVPSASPTPTFKFVQALEAMSIRSESLTRNDIAVFESTCSESFLPQYIPLIAAEYYHLYTCKIINQSPDARRQLQDTTRVAILLNVTAYTEYENPNSFETLLSIVFDRFDHEFRALLADASPRFSAIAGDGSNNDSSTLFDSQGTALIVYVVAGIAGLALAVVASVFLFSGTRVPRHFHSSQATHPMRDPNNDDASSDSDHRSIPSRINADAWIDLESPLSSIRDRANTLSSLNDIDGVDIVSTNQIETNKEFVEVIPVPQSLTERERSLDQKIKRMREGSFDQKRMKLGLQLRSDGSHDVETMHDSDASSTLEGLEIISSCDTSNADSETNAFGKHTGLPPVSPRKSSSFGSRMKSMTRSMNSFRRMEIIPSNDESEFSIDFSRPAGTPMNPSRQYSPRNSSIETPTNNFVGKQNNPTGNQFLQMNVDSAAHTGNVLDDLGELEKEWDSKFIVKATSSVETPQLENTTKFYKARKKMMR